ncbi:MAG: signal peptidase I [Bacteroidales bacterium]|nr:signal peptidase I [Bacteroidales bacterium]
MKKRVKEEPILKKDKYGIKKDDSKFKKFLKKFWFIVWKDDSLKGWITSLAFLFVIIKFVFFPLMSLATGTQLPLVIVESCSMYHDNNLLSNFDDWWQNHDMKYFKLKISEKDWTNFPFQKGFNKGDILFITGAEPKKIEIGDVIIFNANYRNPIIHRVINITQENGKYYFSTIGDNNNGQIEFEKKISETQILGKAQANIAPFLGWGKLIFFEALRNPQERGFCEEN